MRIAGTLIAALVIGLTLPRVVLAQTDTDTQRARDLFSEGVELSGSGQYEQAAAKFQEAYSIVQAPNIAYNLAVALVELGHVVDASEYVQAVLDDAEAPRDVQRLATQLKGTIDARIGHLTVTLIQSRGTASILLDGSSLDDDQIGVAVPVDPGDHVVTAEQGGNVLERQQTSVSAGQSQDVMLDPTTWASGAALDAELYDEAPAEEDDGGGGSILGKWWFWTVVGVVVIGGAIAIGVAASSTEGPLEGNTTPAVGRF